jgi:hypothetical protein
MAMHKSNSSIVIDINKSIDKSIELKSRDDLMSQNSNEKEDNKIVPTHYVNPKLDK